MFLQSCSLPDEIKLAVSVTSSKSLPKPIFVDLLYCNALNLNFVSLWFGLTVWLSVVSPSEYPAVALSVKALCKSCFTTRTIFISKDKQKCLSVENANRLYFYTA